MRTFPAILTLPILALLALPAGPAAAQLRGLPLGGGSPLGVPVGSILHNVSGDVDTLVDHTASDMTSRLDDLATRRLDAAEDRLARHPDVLEKSPQGDLIVRHQLVAYAPSDAALDAARAAGFTIGDTQTLDGLGVRLVVLDAPHGVSTHEALKRLHALDPDGVYDYNDIYLGSASGDGASGQVPTLDKDVRGEGGGRVGLIDGGVDAGHPAFRGATIEQKGFAGAVVPSAHGSATGSLLIGRSDGFAGAAPGSRLLVADVYGDAPTGGSTGAILGALDWLAQKHVAVINVSLVGPSNEPLRAAVATLVGRGYLIVAAVGNDGPAAKPLYPAAFPGVIGVTAVDRKNRVLIEAGRGPQVAFAAPGADMAAAANGNAYVEVRGTSFAAPIVAGLLAQRLTAPDPAAARTAIAALSAKAVDLGAPGRDPVYGAGLVGGDIRPDMRAATAGLKKHS